MLSELTVQNNDFPVSKHAPEFLNPTRPVVLVFYRDICLTGEQLSLAGAVARKAL